VQQIDIWCGCIDALLIIGRGDREYDESAWSGEVGLKAFTLSLLAVSSPID